MSGRRQRLIGAQTTEPQSQPLFPAPVQPLPRPAAGVDIPSL